MEAVLAVVALEDSEVDPLVEEEQVEAGKLPHLLLYSFKNFNNLTYKRMSYYILFCKVYNSNSFYIF